VRLRAGGLRARVRRLLGGATLAGLVAGLVMAFGIAPREATQGNVQRIMYLHVPSVWVAYLAFGVVLVASVVYLVRRDDRADRLAAVLGIVAAFNIPLVHFSVIWWRTLHQPPSLMKPGPGAMPGIIVAALLVNFAAFTLLYVYFVTRRTVVLGLEAEAEA